MNRLSSHFQSESNDKRSLHRVMIEINTTLGAIHKKLPTRIAIDRYTFATAYVAQFIPYTTIWNIKFTYNLESPEVALMQILHLDYILSQENSEDFEKEQQTLQEMKKLFLTYSPYSEKLIAIRKQRFLLYIEHESQIDS